MMVVDVKRLEEELKRNKNEYVGTLLLAVDGWYYLIHEIKENGIVAERFAFAGHFYFEDEIIGKKVTW